jgi:hypothetical protein
MKRSFPVISLAAVILMALAACASLEWVSSPQPAVIKELSTVKTLAVACTTARLAENDHLLVKIGRGDFYNPTDLNGVPYQVSILYESPHAIGDFSVKGDALAALVRDTAAGLIGDTGSFDYPQVKGLSMTRVMGRSIDGATPAGSYEKVLTIPDLLSPDPLPADQVARLGSTYGAQAVLVITPTVFGEIGQLSTRTSRSGGSMDNASLKPGDFILRAWFKMEYRLYDGRNGAKIADSTGVKPQFETMIGIGRDVYPLQISTLPAAKALVLSPDYIKLFKDPVKTGMLPFLTLFRPVFLGTVQKAEQK